MRRNRWADETGAPYCEFPSISTTSSKPASGWHKFIEGVERLQSLTNVPHSLCACIITPELINNHRTCTLVALNPHTPLIQDAGR